MGQIEGRHGQIQPTFALPPWMAAMREAATGCINEADIKEIVKNQVDRAKKGDPNAIKFVFEQVLGGGMKGATFVQNIFTDGPRPDKPGDEVPGTDDKVRLMRRRVAAGLSATNGDDRAHVNLD
jgi:hypothetical protein